MKRNKSEIKMQIKTKTKKIIEEKTQKLLNLLLKEEIYQKER
jgi:hypothetical protein